MEIPPISSSTSSSTTSATVPDFETQIEQLESGEKSHQELISKLSQSDEEKEKNRDRIDVLEAQIELMRAQIDRIRAQEVLQKIDNKANNNDESKKEKGTENSIKTTTPVKDGLNYNIDVTV